MANIFLVPHILFLFHSLKGSWNKSAKYEQLGKYWPYCTQNLAITNAYVRKTTITLHKPINRCLKAKKDCENTIKYFRKICTGPSFSIQFIEIFMIPDKVTIKSVFQSVRDNLTEETINEHSKDNIFIWSQQQIKKT